MQSPGNAGVVVMFLMAVLVPVAALLVARLLMPRIARPEKYTTYECGVDPVGDAWLQYTPRYYLYALVFLIFDVETVFLYPWAIAFHDLGGLAVIEMFIFLALLIAGLAYAWKKGDLEWV